MYKNIIHDNDASHSIAWALVVFFGIILLATIFPEIKDTITTIILAAKKQVG